MRLIVIGAGVAGLAAADAARNAGAEVVVLEARQRVGGRTRTEPLGPGAIDLGAAWVHDPVGNPVAEALAAAGVEAPNEGVFWSRMEVWRGGWLGASEATALTAAIEGDWNPEEAMAALPGSDSFVDAVEWYLDSRDLRGQLRDVVKFGLEWVIGTLVFAGPPERTSLAGTAAYEQEGGGNLVPAGGYRSLVDLLSPGLDIRLDAPASRIEHGDAGVVVHSGEEEFRADRAIVTVPLGVLKAGEIAFDPPLGAEHTGALERLEMGTLEKIAFRFPNQFWPESVWQITNADERGEFPCWFDFTRHVGAPTIVALYNPAVTPSLAELPVERHVERALDVLGEMYGPVPDPEQVLTTDWTHDPWAYGSYSFIPIGAEAADLGRLAEPLSSTATLAGESTVPEHNGTVQGAFVSGLRAAEWALGERPERLTLGPIPPRWLD